MNHPLLDPHEIIAWDIDGTLVNGPNSHFFREYIRAHPQKQHHIVTFRTPRPWAEDVFRELAPFGITREMIAGVHNVADELYHAYAQRRTFEQPEKVAAYLNYKGAKAKELGATVLVDDMADQVIQGCEAHSIVFVDAFDEGFEIVTTTPIAEAAQKSR
jgi:phosphoglycolate phosphatase-like HAD superfamily hydrolase